LAEDEVREIAGEIANLDGASTEDIGVHITKITDALPSSDDVARVERHLTSQHGWPEGD
jgi:hypothetical protein